jgi:hypothetical protein
MQAPDALADKPSSSWGGEAEHQQLGRLVQNELQRFVQGQQGTFEADSSSKNKAGVEVCQGRIVLTFVPPVVSSTRREIDIRVKG